MTEPVPGRELRQADVQARGDFECIAVFPSVTAGLWLTLMRSPVWGDAWSVTHESGYAVAGPEHNRAFGHGDEEAAFRACRLGGIGVDWTMPVEQLLRLPRDVLALVRDALLGNEPGGRLPRSDENGCGSPSDRS
jgi:hypothetical protein